MYRNPLIVGLWGLALVIATGTSARAQTFTWNGGGGDGNWSTATNWSSTAGTAPVSDPTNTLIVLSGTTNLTTVLDLPTGGGVFDISSLSVAANAGAFVVNPIGGTPNTLRINGGGVTVATNSNFSIANPIALGANQAWTNSGTGTFLVSGGLALGGNTLTVAGGGATRITGPVTGGGGITHNGTQALQVTGPVDLTAGAVTLAGTGTATLSGVVSGGNGLTKGGAGTVFLTGANTYTGATAVNQGVLAVSRVTGGTTPLGTNTVTLNGGTLRFLGTNATPMTVTGFNHDVIVSANDFTSPNNGVTPFGASAALDAIVSNPAAVNFLDQFPGFVLYETNQFFPNNGLPVNTTVGRTFVSASNPLTTYRLADYGSGGNALNNTLLVSTGATNEAPTTGTMNIDAGSQGRFQTVSALVLGGGGSPQFTARLLFSDGSFTDVAGLIGPDWFGGNPFALFARGRARRDLDDQNIETQLDNPRLYPVDIAMSTADQAKTLTGITFTRTGGGGRLAVFGLSGAPISTAPTSYTNNVNVTANSTIDLANTPALSLGGLSFAGNFTLATTGPGNSTVAFTGATLNGNPTFNVANALLLNTATINFGNAARTVTKTGAGTQRFDFAAANVNGTNTFVVSGGTATVTNATALGDVINLTVNGGTANMGPYAGLNNLTVSSGTANLTSVTAVNGTATISGGTATFTQGVSIPNATTIISGGTANFNGGATLPTATISGGTSNFGGATTVTTATVNGGTVNLNAATTFTTLSGSGGTINVNGANVLTTGGSNASTAFAGGFGGSGSVVKTGSGTLTLSGIGANTGGMTVSGGQVTATRPGALGTGTVTLANNTTLAIGGLPGNTINGFSGGAGGGATQWTVNNGATIANDVLTITTNAGSLARSAWYNTQQPAGSSFTAIFDYANGPASGNRADGFTFTLQNQALTALGGAGGSLGYSGITPSASLQVNIFNPNGRGLAFRTNGAVAGNGNYTATTPVDVGSGATVRFTITYNAAAQTLAVQLVQGANTFNLPTLTGVNLAGITGANAWVGFTGGTGGETAEQRISNFTYNIAGAVNPPISTYANAVAVAGGGTATLTPILAPSVTSFTMGGLTVGADSALNVQPGAGSLANTPYTLAFGATTLSGTGTLNVLNNGTGAGTVVLGAVGGASGNLVKTGPGTLVLGATTGNTYAGTTTVSQGTLQVTGTVATGGAVAVQTGATLSGTGTLNRAVTVGTGGTLQGGLGTAPNQTLTTGNVTFNAGGTLRVIASNAGGATNTAATGASRIAAAAFGRDSASSVINIFLVSDAANQLVLDGSVTYTRRLATYTSLNNVTEGTFLSTDANNPFAVAGQQFDPGAWQVVVGGNNIDLVFTPVPEPTTVLGVATAGLGLIGLARRRLRRQAEPATAA